jgi:hypothetical protein
MINCDVPFSIAWSIQPQAVVAIFGLTYRVDFAIKLA